MAEFKLKVDGIYVNSIDTQNSRLEMLKLKLNQLLSDTEAYRNLASEFTFEINKGKFDFKYLGPESGSSLDLSTLPAKVREIITEIERLHL